MTGDEIAQCKVQSANFKLEEGTPNPISHHKTRPNENLRVKISLRKERCPVLPLAKGELEGVKGFRRCVLLHYGR